MAHGRRVLRDGFVRVTDGVITEVGTGAAENGTVVDHGEGALVPAFVNAHTHLELSALAGQLATGQGFESWVRELLALRQEQTIDHLRREAGAAAGRMIKAGTLVAGEISTLGITADLFRDAGLAGVWFSEVLGQHLPESVDLPPADQWRASSFAAHAPHTTAPEVLCRLKHMCDERGLPFSIHLAESSEEVEFIQTGKGRWADFLSERGIDFSTWPVPSKSPVAYLADLGLLGPNLMAVHLVYTDAADIALLAQNRVNVCLCPRSNMALHGRLPDVARMAAVGLDLCLGTDSLACVDSLSMVDEMAFVAYKCPALGPEDLLNMATINGAAALGMADRFGSLEPGKKGALVYLPVKAESPKALLERIVSGEGGPVSTWRPEEKKQE
ncbi:MAG: amidohydrolase family protein [Thermodesulfobacteriota bacterium]|nr:amidohydrolase family protein [Thermodesulfobacteriota bacterium]